MVNMQPNTKPNNKIFWIFISIGVILIAAVIAVGLFLAGSESKNIPTPNGTDNPMQGQSYGITTTPPAVTSIDASMEGEQVTFTVKTEEYDSNKWFLEYELADQNRVVVERGFERSNSFTSSTNVSSSAYFRLKIRLSDKDVNSAWSDSFTVKLKDVSGITMLQPNDAYYNTAWAKGEGNPENLHTALATAYGAEPIPYANCLPLNTGTMTPTLLLPPIPSVAPSEAILSYLINSYSETNEASITYYWC